MLKTLIYTFLLSISPFGEARAGIPYAVVNDIPLTWAFAVGLAANLLIFPILMWLIDTFSKRLWPNRVYRRSAVSLSKRAKRGVGAEIQKYGFWGLMVFVMIPLPGTGAYMGTIAAYVLKIERGKAFLAISIGVLVSCTLMAAGSYYGNMGLENL
ncbi:COG2426 family protein [Pontibacter harenae]|uniref:COG2426 family protein n=1 Tax=Pontibacter harenae TaxID=2894083 RepID=UPI001E5BFE55|nr:small multi-drug export protein [Pontibacter harenae]MCC9168805.1 small multi-drug export protein [Pontibacter harenae]